MRITIKNNTAVLQLLKEKAESLPDYEEALVLEPTTASAEHVLVNKTFYYVNAVGTPTLVQGEMSNLGNATLNVGLDGVANNYTNGYVSSITAQFSDDVNNEIAAQADLINQIKTILINKFSKYGGKD